jgi:HlyD family secretion protein
MIAPISRSPATAADQPREVQTGIRAGQRRRDFGRILFFALLIGLIGLGAWHFGPALRQMIGPSAGTAPILLSGNIEAHQSVLSFAQVQAPVVTLPFDEGTVVAAGTVLARLDDRLYRQQAEIDRANVEVARAQQAVNESSLAAAEHTVASDQFDLSQKQSDYDRAEALVRSNAVSRQSRDQALTAAQQAAATLARDQAMVRQANANIALARANVDAAAAKLAYDEVLLSYTTLVAPFPGVIAVRQAELGQLAGPGVAIFTLDDLDHVWLRAYVNEPDLGRVRLGQEAVVTTDTYPGKRYKGRVSFISPEAEFTPKTVETHAERVTLVYRIRIDIDNPTHELLPGMPADATFTPLPAGS